jgi:hypothetical protein
MANEIKTAYTSGKALYAVVLSSGAQAWNTSSSAFEAIAAADWTHYGVALAELSACGVYAGSFPTAITASGIYNVIVYCKAGSTAAPTDTVVGGGQIDWNGSAEDPAGALKNDPRFKRLLAYADSNYTFAAGSSSGVLTQYDTDGVTVLFTVTTQFNAAGNITSRTVSYPS